MAPIRGRQELTTSHIAPAAKALAWETSGFITDRELLARFLLNIPPRLHLPAVSAWARRYKAAGNVSANIELRDMSEAFGRSGLDFSATDDEIVELAKSRALNAQGYVMDRMTTPEALR